MARRLKSSVGGVIVTFGGDLRCIQHTQDRDRETNRQILNFSPDGMILDVVYKNNKIRTRRKPRENKRQKKSKKHEKAPGQDPRPEQKISAQVLNRARICFESPIPAELQNTPRPTKAIVPHSSPYLLEHKHLDVSRS